MGTELWKRVHAQQVQPRQTVTEALLHYFRYKDGRVPTTIETDPLPDIVNVNTSKQHLPDGSLMLDVEYAKLEMGCGSL